MAYTRWGVCILTRATLRHTTAVPDDNASWLMQEEMLKNSEEYYQVRNSLSISA